MNRKNIFLTRAFSFSLIAIQIMPNLAFAQKPRPMPGVQNRPTTVAPVPLVTPVTRTPITIEEEETAELAVIAPRLSISANIEAPVSTNASATRSISARAPAETAAARPANDYLSLDDAKAAFRNFKIELIGSKVSLSGVAFTQCRQLNPNFSVGVVKDLESAKFGFEIKDPNGAVRGCMTQMLAQGNNCQTHACSRITQEFELPLEHDAKVSFFQRSEFAMEDRPSVDWKEFPIAEYKGTDSQAKETREKAEARRKERIAELEADYTACANSPIHIDVAYDSIQKLLREGLDDEEADKRDKKLANNEFNFLLRNAVSVDCKDHIDDMRSKAQDLASRHPEYSDRIASKVYPAIGRCVLTEREGEEDGEITLADWAAAKEILEEAGELPGLSAKTRTELKQQSKDLKTGRTNFVADRGRAGSTEYMKARAQMAQELSREWNACMRNPPRSIERSAACQETGTKLFGDPRTQQPSALQALDMRFNQAIMRERQYQQQFLSYGGNGMGMGGQFGGGGTNPGMTGPIPLSGSGAMQQPNFVAGGNPQFGPQGMPQNFQSGQPGQPGMWQGGNYGAGANPYLNY